MRPISVSVGPLAGASAAFYVASVTPSSGQSFTAATTPALVHTSSPDSARRLSVAYGNEVGQRTLTVAGTNSAGNPITEIITIPSGGAGSPVQSVLDYLTVTSIISGGGAFSNAITIGTNGVASSPWVRLDDWGFPQTSLQVIVSGTVNYTVEQTLDDPNDTTQNITPSAMTWLAHAVLVSQTASQQDNYAFQPKFTRITLNSGAGSCKYTVLQTATPMSIGGGV